MKAVSEVGWKKAARFGAFTLAMVPYRLALFPPLRVAWLRMLGARIGSRVVLHDVRFFNLYRRGLSGLSMGDDCFLGDECLLDLAEGIVPATSGTLAERVLVLTPYQRGYKDHPAPEYFPASSARCPIEKRLVSGRNVRSSLGSRSSPRLVAAGAVVTPLPAADAGGGCPRAAVCDPGCPGPRMRLPRASWLAASRSCSSGGRLRGEVFYQRVTST